MPDYSPQPYATRVLDASVEFYQQHLASPLVLSTGAIESVSEARVSVTVEVGGQAQVGRGSIYLSDLWAWPDPALSHEQRDKALRLCSQWIAGNLASLCGGEPAHPMELGLRLHHQVCEQGGPAQDPPVLGLAMCLSPFDAAIHDAAGLALNRSAFALYDQHGPIPSADAFFDGQPAADAIVRMLRPKPLKALPAWLIVGKNDDLSERVEPWVRQRGYGCFKLKIMGRDNDADVQRTVEVYRALKRFGVESPRLSVDSNEANPDARSVLDYLERLEAADVQAYQALEYLEQPTGRDITEHTHDWREVTGHKPVLLDEGLTSLNLLALARNQGWSGLALKTCKGHSFALLAAAWAHAHEMPLALQDLTNPGYSAIHGALFAAHVPTINGVELNSPQFTPEANRPWLNHLSPLFEPTDGQHYLPNPDPPGLGSCL